MRILRALVAAWLLILSAAAVEPGVSRALARERAARVSHVHYALGFTLAPHAASTAGHELLTFQNSAPGDLALDFRDGVVSAASLNGKPIAPTLDNGHLLLPASLLLQGINRFEVTFTANVATAGKAITRYEDKDDGSEYLYTLFVPMDASMAFPCFDQPDLKARFTLTVAAPKDWTMIGNTAGQATEEPQASGDRRWNFPETEPISTYLFAFAAGPFARIAPHIPGQPALFVRRSQQARAQPEASAVQSVTQRGVAFLSDYFAQPFPFPKYDLVLIPGFPFGGMEHAGATFLNEDAVLFRTAPTEADYFRRDILILHETCHQWFGDLVTMQWFDDLWLKEGFAQYMAYKAMAQLAPETAPWKHFYEDIKPLAYGIDETEGTTPIYQQIPNLRDAKSAYGAIVYQKAPAVLKQLNFRLGEQGFRDGLRLYLKQHAYSNAQWADLIAAFEATSHTDVKTWADAWILHRGMPEVAAEFTCRAGLLSAIRLSQHDVLGTGFVWPIATDLYLAPSSGSRPLEPVRVDLTGRTLVLPGAHRACPAFLFANYDDQAYGRFLLDSQSEAAVTRQVLLPQSSPTPTASLLHAQLWGALWENVRVARAPAAAYVDLALEALPAEQDESLNRILGGRLATALHVYLGPRTRAAALPRIETTVSAKMLHGQTAGQRIVNFRTFTAVAETPRALQELTSLLHGSEQVPGMPLKLQDRWNLVAHLTQMAAPDAAHLFALEQAGDQSGEAQRYAFAAGAGVPDEQVKLRYFDNYRNVGKVQEDWLTQSLGPFNSWNQRALTLPWLSAALDLLPEIKRDRKIFFLGAWLNAFVGGQNSPEAQSLVHAWLQQPSVDPDLRLKVLQVSSDLDRTVMIRQRYPE